MFQRSVTSLGARTKSLCSGIPHNKPLCRERVGRIVHWMAKRLSPTKRKNARTVSAREDRDGERPSARKKAVSCPIVGIGGSAGGFEAAMELLHHLPPKNGMAFVIVQHLDPHHASRLPTLLSRATQMSVLEIS